MPDIETSVETTQEVATPTAVTQEVATDTTAENIRLQKEIADLRKENAKHRTTNKDAERTAMTEAGQFKTLYEQSTAELETLRGDIAKRDREALLTKVAKAAGLPEDLIDRIKGETEEELLTDAKAMAKRLIQPAPSTGATNPGRDASAPHTSNRNGIRGIGN